MKQNLPKIFIREDSLVVSFPRQARVLSWAPLGAGFTKAAHWINHQVRPDFAKQWKDRPLSEPPDKTLGRVARRLGLWGRVVGQMTSGDIRRFQKAARTRMGWTVTAVATAGFSNALRVGDKARHGSRTVGTINLLVWVSKPLALSSLLEVLQVAVEARTLAVMEHGVKSRVSGRRATGTGTDCVAVACPTGAARRVYAGKHTVLGELTGRVVLRAMGIR